MPILISSKDKHSAKSFINKSIFLLNYDVVDDSALTLGKPSDSNRFYTLERNTQIPVICVYDDPAYDNPNTSWHLV